MYILLNDICYGLNDCVTQNSYVEILIPNVMVVGGKAFGRYLDYEGGNFINKIGVLIEETPRSPLASFCHVRLQ